MLAEPVIVQVEVCSLREAEFSLVELKHTPFQPAIATS